jgi:phosphohistidine phosphatase
VHLLILRHAKSSWADPYTDDWERALTERGARDAAAVGRMLRTLSLVPDLIITSDAVRAQTTAHAVAEAAAYPGKVVMASQLYHAQPDAVIDVIRTAPDSAPRLMIVGHNPGLEDLVTRLTGEHIGLATATLLHLELPVTRWQDVDQRTGASVIDAWNAADL